MVAYAPPHTLPSLRALLYPEELPPGFTAVPLDPCEDATLAGEARACRAERWLAPAGAASTLPLAIDAGITTFSTVTAALRFLTAPAPAPDGMVARRLFAPRIGAGTRAVRLEVVSGDARYAIYRVGAQVDRRVATVAAVWRWPAGSPTTFTAGPAPSPSASRRRRAREGRRMAPRRDGEPGGRAEIARWARCGARRRRVNWHEAVAGHRAIAESSPRPSLPSGAR